MGVLSRALGFAIFGSIIISGCAIGPSSDLSSWPEGAGPDELAEVSSGEGAGLPSDSTLQRGAAAADLVAETNLSSRGIAAIASGGLRRLPVSDVSGLGSGSSGRVLDSPFGIERGEGFSRFVFTTGATEPVFDVMQMQSPPRLVVDLLGEKVDSKRDVPVEGDPFLRRVRVEPIAQGERITFELQTGGGDSVDHSIDSRDGRLMVTFLDAVALAAGGALPEFLSQEGAEDGGAKMASNAKGVVGSTSSDSDSGGSVAPALLEVLTLKREGNSRGEVVLQLDRQVDYRLTKTSPSEYVLAIPNAKAAPQARVPQIVPRKSPGIRAARAVESDGDLLVRMFVDPMVTLVADRREGSIVIEESSAGAPADSPLARAQIAKPASSSSVLSSPTGSPAAPAHSFLQRGDEITGEGLSPGARAQVDAAAEGEGMEEGQDAREHPTGVRAADGSKIYTGRLISLDLQDTDIDNALRIIAEVSNLNIIASDDVSGKVTLRLIDVPWDQALDVILKTNGLGQITEGNVIRIAPVANLQEEAEALSRAKMARRQLEDLNVNYVRISYARAEELVEHIEGVLTERGTVTADERTNQLIIRDTKRGLEAAAELIKKLDLRTPQVLLETQIVEGQRNILRDLGFQWNFSYIQSPETGNATGLNFPNSIKIEGSHTDGTLPWAVNFPAVLGESGSAVTAILDSADGSRVLAARLSALETEGKVRVVSRPQVATVNNKPATIESVETVRVRLPSTGTTVGVGAGSTASGGGSSAFEEIDVGITLKVTPQASPDYYVLLDVEANSSTFGGQAVDNIPSTLERTATSTILVKSGQTFALGGVYRVNDQDTLDGVPWLKDVPVLGFLFRRSFVKKSDEELIFFITPHIVEGSFDSELMEEKDGAGNVGEGSSA